MEGHTQAPHRCSSNVCCSVNPFLLRHRTHFPPLSELDVFKGQDGVLPAGLRTPDAVKARQAASGEGALAPQVTDRARGGVGATLAGCFDDDEEAGSEDEEAGTPLEACIELISVLRGRRYSLPSATAAVWNLYSSVGAVTVEDLAEDAAACEAWWAALEAEAGTASVEGQAVLPCAAAAATPAPQSRVQHALSPCSDPTCAASPADASHREQEGGLSTPPRPRGSSGGGGSSRSDVQWPPPPSATSLMSPYAAGGMTWAEEDALVEEEGEGGRSGSWEACKPPHTPLRGSGGRGHDGATSAAASPWMPARFSRCSVPDIWCLSPAAPSPLVSKLHHRQAVVGSHDGSSHAAVDLLSPIGNPSCVLDSVQPAVLDFSDAGSGARPLPSAKPITGLGCLDLSPLLAPASPPPRFRLSGRVDSSCGLAEVLDRCTGHKGLTLDDAEEDDPICAALSSFTL